MTFNIEIVLPSSKTIRVKELSNRDYLTIVKYCQNKDIIGLGSFFDKLYFNEDLDIIERFYALIYIRMMFVNPDITLTVNKRDIRIDIATILDRIEERYRDLARTITDGDIEIKLELPHATYFKSVDEIYKACITEITVGDQHINFTALSEDDQEDIMNNLPATTFSQIVAFMTSIQDNFTNIILIEGNESIGIEELEIGLLGNGCLSFVSSLFNMDLNNFYSLIYTFQNTILPGSNYFFEMSPIETQAILNAHQKRLAEEQRQLQKQNER